MRQLADITEDALIRVDIEAHREFGADEFAWQSWQRREYDLRLDAARFDEAVVA